jgi:hypothetical protein
LSCDRASRVVDTGCWVIIENINRTITEYVSLAPSAGAMTNQ